MWVDEGYMPVAGLCMLPILGACGLTGFAYYEGRGEAMGASQMVPALLFS